MLTRIMAAGLLAGVLSGVCVAALQHATTVPLILQAESYESAAPAAQPHRHSSSAMPRTSLFILAHTTADESRDAADGHATARQQPAAGLERTAATTVTTIGTATGFALMLLALMLASGITITVRQAALWGIGAFFATGLAPAIGLPPELPGAVGADLTSRQLWWVSTAVTTSAGIWLMFRHATVATIAIGIALLALPHVIGAPQSPSLTSLVPAELAGRFTAASLGVHAVMWLLTGALAGFFWQKFERSAALA